jgi:hypothetical protein
MSCSLISPYSYFDVSQTASALHTFILATWYSIQAHACAEIDQVMSHDKMPCLDDGASLPYLDAILRNVLRWYPLSPLVGQSAPT